MPTSLSPSQAVTVRLACSSMPSMHSLSSTGRRSARVDRVSTSMNWSGLIGWLIRYSIPHPPVSGGQSPARCSALSGNHVFRLGSVLVLSGIAVQYQEHQQYDCTDKRNQCNQQPPAAAVRPMKPTHCYGQTGNQNGQCIYSTQQAHSRCLAESTGNTVEESQNNTDDGIEQDKVPVLLSSGPSTESRIVFQYFHIPIHTISF